MESECTIQGADIVSPKIRIAIYVQTSLIILKIFSNQKEIIKFALFAVGTSFALIISAILQYHNNKLHYIFQIEVTYLASLLILVSYYALISLSTIPKKRIYSIIGLLCSLASLLMICYSIWIWTTIKWKLSEQECGDKVKVFWLTIPLNPTGWVRVFALISLGSNVLIPFVTSIVFAILIFTWDDDDDDDGYYYDGDLKIAMACELCYALPIIAMTIASSEILIHKNPISEIPINWGVKEIVILIMVGGDVATTILTIVNQCLHLY
ncbi:hypothetical protein Glove_319g132 [Diversispora epigaea]|uniref:Uncharacterized protein n=1 Tax=Diversispora epigaea TaxID=1348612 RepID=A0A397HT40_9GLOM|nr:hypothetical protein Glove_319g132 [Diversispora epigaea]